MQERHSEPHPRDYGTGRDEEKEFYSADSERGPHYGKGPKNYRRSDERIEEEVNDTLWRRGDIDASEIEVKVLSGIVTLSGLVDRRETRRAAEIAIENIGGVVDVRNELRLKRNEKASVSAYSRTSPGKPIDMM